MKKRVKNKLLLLLSVRAGICPVHVREKLDRSLASDPLLNQRLNLVNLVWDRGELPSSGIDQRALEGDIIFDPETIASFVEGQLEPEKADIVTRSAWNSPALLAEICDIFRAVHGSETISCEIRSLSSFDEERLANRLTALIDLESANGKSREQEMSPQVNGAIFRDSMHSGNLPVKSSRKKSIGSWVAPAVAIAAAIVVIVRLLPLQREPVDTVNPSAEAGKLAEGSSKPSFDESTGAQALGENENRTPGATVPTVSTSNDEGIAENPVPDGKRLPNGEEKSNAEMREPWYAFSGDRLPAEIGKLSGNDVNSPGKTGGASPDSAAENGETFTLVKEQLRFELGQVKGVIGLFVEPKSLWCGYASSPTGEFENQATTVVFSGSWVRAKIPDGGEWVLDADTEIRLTRESLVPQLPAGQTTANPALAVRAPQYCLEVFSGRVGIENLPDKTDLSVRYMSREFNVKTASDDSIIAFDAYGDQPVLSVKRGKVEIEGELLPVGRSRFFSGENVGKNLPTRHSLRWLDRPETYVRLSDKLQSDLIVADDLCGEFQRMVRLDEPAIRRAAGLWLMSVKPELIAESLRHPNITDWNLLMEWLAVQHRRGYRQRAIWVSLGEWVGDEQFGRQLFLWTRMLELRQKPSVEQADRFMAYLNHESLFARFATARILEDCFANPFQYEPMQAPERRIAAARAWRRHIIQFLGR